MKIYRTRRLIAMICMALLAALAGFSWGHWYGYRQGKADTIKAIERGLNEPRTNQILI